MHILSFDTALQTCSVAIIRGDETVFDKFYLLGKNNAETLPILVFDALKSTKTRIADLDRVAVVRGPGSFTGLRTGLAFARGLVLGTKAIAIGVTSTQALAASHPAPPQTVTAPVIDARRGEVFAAAYDAALNEIIAPFAAAPAVARARLLEGLSDGPAPTPVRLIGSGAKLIPDPPACWRREDDADAIDPVALARLAAAAPIPTDPPQPLYLRAPDAKPSAAALFQGLPTS